METPDEARETMEEDARPVEASSAGSADPRRPGGWPLLVGVVLVAGIAGFYTPRLLRQSERAGQESVPSPGPTRPATAPSGPDAALRPPSAAQAPRVDAAGGVPEALSTNAVEEESAPPKSVGEVIEEAKQTAASLVAALPDHPDALELKARTHAFLGNSDEARAAWQRCLELDPGYAYAYFGLGSLAAKEGDYEKAVDLLRKGLALAPGGYKPVFGLADSLIKLGRLDEATETLQSHVKRDPRAAWSQYLLGQIHLQRREHEKAVEAYEAALAIHDDQSGAGSGSAAGHDTQFQEYMRELDRLRVSALYGLGTAYLRLGREEKSAECMERFKKLREAEKQARSEGKREYDDLETMCRAFALTFTHVARVYYANGLPAQAEKLCQRAAALDPSNTECLTQMVALYEQTGRPEQALRTAQRLTEIDPENAVWHLNLGLMYARANRFVAAEAAFRKASEVAPDKSWGHRELARLYLAANRQLPQAKQHAQQAVRLEPLAANYFMLSEACHKAGDPAGALAAIKRASDLDPGNPAYRRIHELLQSAAPK